MRRPIIRVIMLVALAASSAHAEENSSLNLPKFATLTDGQKVEPGDVIYLRRPFGPWTLQCDLLLSADKRLCTTEQVLKDSNNILSWRIAMTVDNRPYAVIFAQPGIDVAEGIRIGFSGVEKTLRDQEIACNAARCVAMFPFEGFVQAAVLSTKTIWFSYHKKAQGKVTLSANMNGLKDALNAAATNPYAPIKKTEKPKKPPASPKKANAKPATQNGYY